MENAFLVIRTVFFALLTYFHALVIVFASWNLVAARSSGISTPGASVFLLMNSVFIFVLVPVAYLAELICPKARPAYVRVECTWTVLMSFLQLAASVDVTVNGPPKYCQSNSPWGMCASSSLLVHISWLLTLIIFAYCLTLCLVSAAHAASLPDIWITPIPHVPWFNLRAETPAPVVISHLPTHKHSKIPSSPPVSRTSCAVSKYIAERWEKLSRTERQPVSSGPILFTKGRQSVDNIRPTWARHHRIRRGVDNPFAKPLPKRPKESPVVLAPPPRTRSRQVVTTRDSHSTTVVGELPQTKTYSYSTQSSGTSCVFPQTLANPDLPILRPNRSEWVRADVLSWISVDTGRSSS